MNKCKDCKWWREWRRPFVTGFGTCRGAPPLKGAFPTSKDLRAWQQAEWPLTSHDDYCGTFSLEGVVLEQSEKLDGTIVQTIRLRDGSEIVREGATP